MLSFLLGHQAVHHVFRFRYMSVGGALKLESCAQKLESCLAPEDISPRISRRFNRFLSQSSFHISKLLVIQDPQIYDVDYMIPGSFQCWCLLISSMPRQVPFHQTGESGWSHVESVGAQGTALPGAKSGWIRFPRDHSNSLLSQLFVVVIQVHTILNVLFEL